MAAKSKSFSLRTQDEWLLACITQQAQGESLSDSQVIVKALKHYFSYCEYNPDPAGADPESPQPSSPGEDKKSGLDDLLNFE